MQANSDERPRTLEAGDPWIDETCEVCGEALAAGQRALECPRCHALHHTDCWRSRGGCGRRGCRQVAAALRPDEARQTDDERAKAFQNPKRDRFLAITLATALVGLLFYTFWADRQRPEPDLVILMPAEVAREPIMEGVNAYAAPLALRVEPVFAPLGPLGTYFQQKLVTMVAADDSPDMILMPREPLETLASLGVLVDLRDEITIPAGPGFDADRLRDGVIDDVQVAIPHPTDDLYFAVPTSATHPERGIAAITHILSHLAEPGT